MTMTTGDDDGSCPRRAGSSPTSTAAQDRAYIKLHSLRNCYFYCSIRLQNDPKFIERDFKTLLLLCYHSGECLRGKSPPDRMLAPSVSGSFWAKPGCFCCPA